MSTEREQFDEPGSVPNSVDNLIRRALAVDVDSSQLARLESFWRQHRRRNLWRQRAITCGGLAAAAMIAVAVIIGLARLDEPVAFKRERLGQTKLAQIDHASVDNESSSIPINDDLAASFGRPPTAYERFVFTARTRRAVSPASSPTVAIEELILRLSKNPLADAGQALAETGVGQEQAEGLLLRRLPRASDAEARTITRLLAECGGGRSVPALLRIGRREALREDVVATIERIIGLKRLAEAVDATNDRDLRSAIARRTLTSGSDAALRSYLSLVARGETRDEALAVARQVPDVPTDALFMLLDDEDNAIRLSAALVLGAVNGPEVTRTLIARVTTKPAGSNEAWLALFACRGELADQFFAYASQRPQLLGYVNGARLRWTQMIH